jgi:hypothetical protein
LDSKKQSAPEQAAENGPVGRAVVNWEQTLRQQWGTLRFGACRGGGRSPRSTTCWPRLSGVKEEGTITTPFDMTVLNDLDRFHLVMDTSNRLPQTGDKDLYLKQQLKDRLIEHKQYIDKHGQDMPEIRNPTNAAKPA